MMKGFHIVSIKDIDVRNGSGQQRASREETRESSSIKAKLLQLKLIRIFARAILLMKKLEIEKTKSTFITSVLKVEF